MDNLLMDAWIWLEMSGNGARIYITMILKLPQWLAFPKKEFGVVEEEFEHRFNSHGKILYLSRKQNIPKELTKLDAVKIFRQALQYANGFKKEFLFSKYHVTTFCPKGKIQLIFLIYKKTSREKIERWKNYIHKANLKASLDFNQAA